MIFEHLPDSTSRDSNLGWTQTDAVDCRRVESECIRPYLITVFIHRLLVFIAARKPYTLNLFSTSGPSVLYVWVYTHTMLLEWPRGPHNTKVLKVSCRYTIARSNVLMYAQLVRARRCAAAPFERNRPKPATHVSRRGTMSLVTVPYPSRSMGW